MRSIIFYFTILAPLMAVCAATDVFAQKRPVRIPTGPFPMVTAVKKNGATLPVKLNVYPNYAEVYSDKGTLIFKVGILPDKGEYKVYTMLDTAVPKFVAYTDGLIIYDSDDHFIGSYFRTPVYTYVYSKSGKRLGSVKCIAFSAVCGAAAAVYLILL